MRWRGLAYAQQLSHLTRHILKQGMVALCGISLLCQQGTAVPMLSGNAVKKIHTYQVVTYHYDAWSRLINRILPDAISTVYHYDEYGGISNIIHYKTAQEQKVILGFTYTYNQDGSIRQRVRIDGLGQQSVEQYGYDYNYNLKDYQCSGTLCPRDAQGKVIGYQHYTFDGFNNIKTVTSNNTITTYEYNQQLPTRLISYHNTNPTYPISQKIRYDCNGNILQDSQGNVITYDPLDQTHSVNTRQGITTYFYNGEGRQVGEGIPSGKTTYLIYGQGMLLNARVGSQQTSFLYGANRLGKQDDEGTQYYLTDQGGSVINTINQAKAQEQVQNINIYAYSPYGIESDLTKQASNTIPAQYFGFDGQLTDGKTNWQFLGQGYRAYNPMLHRFMSQDSMSPFDKGGINGYIFGSNNPIMIIDPGGHFGMSILYATLSIVTLAMIVKNIFTARNNEIKWLSLVFGMSTPFFSVAGFSIEGAEVMQGILSGISAGISMQLEQINGKEHKQKISNLSTGDWLGMGFSGLMGLLSGYFLGDVVESFKDVGYYGGAMIDKEYVTDLSVWMEQGEEEEKLYTTWNTANLVRGSGFSAIINATSNTIYSLALNTYNRFASHINISTKKIEQNTFEDFGFGFLAGAITPMSFHIQNNFNASKDFQGFGYFMSGSINGSLPYAISFVQGMF